MANTHTQGACMCVCVYMAECLVVRQRAQQQQTSSLDRGTDRWTDRQTDGWMDGQTDMLSIANQSTDSSWP